MLPGLLGFTETTSYTYPGVTADALCVCACARFGVACARPNTTGTAIAASPAAPSNSFLLKSNLRVAPSVMMRTIRFFKSAPVTPDTQASGDPTQYSQTFKILSAYTWRSLPNARTSSSQAHRSEEH